MAAFDIWLLPDLKKEVSVARLIGCIRQVKAGVPKTPVDSIKFTDLPWIPFQETEWKNSPELRSLRNFIVGRQKAIVEDDELNTAILIFAESTEANPNRITLSLEFNAELLQKISEVLLVDPLRNSLDITVDVSDEAESDTGVVLGTQYFNEYTGNDISDLVLREEKVFQLIALPLGTRHFGKLTEQFLERISDENLTFSWKVTVRGAPPKEDRSLVKLNADKILQSLYDSECSKDLMIVAMNGAEIKCHRGILMCQSDCFAAMLSSQTGMREAETGKIELKLNSEECLRHFVRILYGLEFPEAILSPDLALELIQLAHHYQIHELVGKIKNFLSQKLVDWFTVNNLVELYAFTKNVERLEDLKAHVLLEMSRLPVGAVKSCEYFKELDKNGGKELLLNIKAYKP